MPEQEMPERCLAAAALPGDGGDRRSVVGDRERDVVKRDHRFALAQQSTSDAVLRRELLQHGCFNKTALERVRTTRRERTARGQVEQRRR